MHLQEMRNMDDVSQRGEDSLDTWKDLMLLRGKGRQRDPRRSLRGSSETEGIKMRSKKQESKHVINCITVSNYLLPTLWEDYTSPPVAI